MILLRVKSTGYLCFALILGCTESVSGETFDALEHQVKERYETLFAHRNPWRYSITDKQRQRFAQHLASVTNFVEARRLSPAQVLIGRKNEKTATQRARDFEYIKGTWDELLYFLGSTFRELRGKSSSATVLSWEKLDKDKSAHSIKKIQEAFAKIERKKDHIEVIYRRALRDKASCKGGIMRCQQRFALVALHAEYLKKAIELVGESIKRLQDFVASGGKIRDRDDQK